MARTKLLYRLDNALQKLSDNKILLYARKEVDQLLLDDFDLSKSENINIARFYRPYARERMGWSRIS